jgi:hypothetical protein
LRNLKKRGWGGGETKKELKILKKQKRKLKEKIKIVPSVMWKDSCQPVLGLLNFRRYTEIFWWVRVLN